MPSPPLDLYARHRTLFNVGVAIGLWGLFSLLSFFFLAVPNANRFDFYPRWIGARAVLAGENPYTESVSARIQIGMFGRVRGSNEDQQRFAYPATITWILLPFWFLPFSISVSLWCGLILVIFFALPLVVADTLGWHLSRLALVSLLVFSIVLYRYPIICYLIGQFLPPALGAIILTWRFITRGNAWLAALTLIVATVRTDAAVMILVLLFALWRGGKRNAVMFWFGAMIGLWLLTRAFIGPWEVDFVKGIFAYADYAVSLWVPSLFGTPWLAWAVTIISVAWGAWMFNSTRHLSNEIRLARELAVAVLVSLIVFPQTGGYTLIYALIPALVILGSSPRRWFDYVPVLAILTVPFLFVIGLFQWLPHASEQFIIPFAFGILLTIHSAKVNPTRSELA